MANITDISLNYFIAETQHTFLNFLNQEFKFDKEADSWTFMSTPWPLFLTLTVYLLFVLKLGPKMMENREPLNIKYIMMAYNLFQTIYNIFMVSELFFTPGILNYVLDNACHPEENNRVFINKIYISGWHFVISKVFDLIDTVFFILKKKQSHVSFLHVYHHVSMAISSWTYLRFFKGQQSVLMGAMNAMIHSIMYSYYFLSAFGSHIQKYLWWKKYLTRLQILQFIVGIFYGIGLFIFDCTFPRVFSVFMIFNVLLFLHLFLIFYKKTYNDKKKSQ